MPGQFARLRTVLSENGMCEIPSARMFGLAHSALGIAPAVDAEDLGGPLQSRAPHSALGVRFPGLGPVDFPGLDPPEVVTGGAAGDDS